LLGGSRSNEIIAHVLVFPPVALTDEPGTHPEPNWELISAFSVVSKTYRTSLQLKRFASFSLNHQRIYFSWSTIWCGLCNMCCRVRFAGIVPPKLVYANGLGFSGKFPSFLSLIPLVLLVSLLNGKHRSTTPCPLSRTSTPCASLYPTRPAERTSRSTLPRHPTPTLSCE
jgi:hypothetical protein